MTFDEKILGNKQHIFQIFKKWEIRRIPYNLILLVIIVLGIWPVWPKVPNHTIFLLENMISLIQANILYFSGAVLEIGFSFFNKDISKYRLLLWIAGTFFSVLIALYSIMIVYNRYGLII